MLIQGVHQNQFRAAVTSGDEANVSQALAEGHSVNRDFGVGWTPLHYAVKAGKMNIVKLLISKGAVINAETDVWRTPFDIAETQGFSEIAELLEQSGGRRSVELSVHAAIYAGDKKQVNRLLQAGTALDEKRHGQLPICIAIRRNNWEVVRLLLKQGADVRCVEEDGTTSLIAACQESADQTLVASILKKGADVNAVRGTPAFNTDTALSAAAGHGNREVVALLIRHGADPNACSALWSAIGEKHFDVARDLINAGASFSLTDAVECCAIDLVQQKIDEGEDVNPPGAYRPPLFIAAESERTDMVKLLLENGADVNAQTEIHRSRSFTWGGETPLHAAVKKRSAPLVRLLMASGANPNIPNAEGQSALDIATVGKCSHLLPLLDAPPLEPSGSPEQLCTFERVAEILSVDTAFVASLVDDRKLKTVTLAKGVVRIPESSLKRYQKSIGL